MIRRTTCRTVRDLLPLHAGGDLPSDKAVLVDEHLHACLTCFREFRDYAAMRGRLGVLSEEPLPEGALDGFTEEVMACVALGEAGPAAQLPTARRWRLDAPALRWAAAAAVLVALGAGVWRLNFVPAPGVPAGGVDSPLASSDAPAVDVPADAPTRVRLSDVHAPRLEPSRGVLVGDGLGQRVRDQSRGMPLLPLEMLPQPDLQPGLLFPEPGRQLRLRNPLDER